jgi:sugar/nucleoside kinase (ribokinase family)
MTLGEGGSLILKRGEKILKIPAFKAREVLDETGAGDVYFAIFLYELSISDKTWRSVEKAGYLASCAASFNVEQTGPHGFETKERVLERLNAKNYIEN